MYEYLVVPKITAKYIVLEANGIGHILHVASILLGQVNQKQIYIASKSFGGSSRYISAKTELSSLISVSGIGPVSAVLSQRMTMQDLFKRLRLEYHLLD